MRAPDKRVFKVDVGNLPPNEIDAYIEKMITKMKKVPYIDERTGEYNLRFNLQNMIEDFVIPVRGNDSGNSIEPLGGMEFTGIDDIEYLRNKMMAALKIPKAFLGYDESLSGKATLASEDIRFGRTIQRIQRFILSELSKIAVIHLYSQGYRDATLVDFELELTNPSTIFEKEKIDIWTAKTDVAKSMMEFKLFSKKWVHENIFKMSDDLQAKINNEVIEDTKQNWRLKQIEEEGNDPAKPFQKINSNADGDGEDRGGLGGLGDIGSSGGPDLGGPIGGPEGPEGGPEGNLGGEPGGEPPDLPPLKEILNSDENYLFSDTEEDISEDTTQREINKERAKNRPSQKGEKDATNYPFGEDPLGNLENNSALKVENLNTIKYTLKSDSPLRIENLKKSSFLTRLEDYLSKSESVKKDLLNESNSKHMLDENNIKE
jgi:hypothetical protein